MNGTGERLRPQSAALRHTDTAEIMRADHSQRVGVAIGAAAEEFQPSRRKKAFMGRHELH